MASIYSNEYQIVIKALREARIAKGITQESLAQALDRPQSFIAKVENGERRLDVVEFVHISSLLSLNPADIIEKIIPKYTYFDKKTNSKRK
ncbi:helix-turn-helix transcriptional regulator [Budviciaceae bacterium BWR-B9]|uniref:Helix-turn-helix transcriptional regulator n=1 Tax=Limnobaculum allomyrinae TaxID=2791986 RepID=A0ABS1ISV2_9GAMM|nr:MULTISPECIES: helix-turn-helix transcriptional regulator [Limnobaculum]MBK5144840.1 helix-turn-helix transcriptional regulator [Limnobaculum allomyrinae]MBV7692503.1 helix-turn-helix domain-containing protein [Limnobaculum sp. M2-1]